MGVGALGKSGLTLAVAAFFVFSMFNGVQPVHATTPITMTLYFYYTQYYPANLFVDGHRVILHYNADYAWGTATFTNTAYTAPTYNVTAALIRIQKQLNASALAEQTEQKDMKGNFTAITSALAAITTSLNSIGNTVNSISGAVTTLSSSVSSIQNSLTTLSSTVNTINTNVQGLSTPISNAATQATNAANAVNTTSNYVLVVAVLAAITLVLELAILVRKLS